MPPLPAQPRTAPAFGASLLLLAAACSGGGSSGSAAGSASTSAPSAPTSAVTSSAPAPAPAVKLFAHKLEDKYDPMYVRRLGPDLALIAAYRLGIVQRDGAVISFAKNARDKLDLVQIQQRGPADIRGRFPGPLFVFTHDSASEPYGARRFATWYLRDKPGQTWYAPESQPIDYLEHTGGKFIAAHWNSVEEIEKDTEIVDRIKTPHCNESPMLHRFAAFPEGDIVALAGDCVHKPFMVRWPDGKHAPVIDQLPEAPLLPSSADLAALSFAESAGDYTAVLGRRRDDIAVVLREDTTGNYIARFDGAAWKAVPVQGAGKITAAAMGDDGRLWCVFADEGRPMPGREIRVSHVDRTGRWSDAMVPGDDEKIQVRSVETSVQGDVYITFTVGVGGAAILWTSRPDFPMAEMIKL